MSQSLEIFVQSPGKAADCLFAGYFFSNNCKQLLPYLAEEVCQLLKSSWPSEVSVGNLKYLHCFPSWVLCDVRFGPSAWLHRWGWKPSPVLRKQKEGPQRRGGGGGINRTIEVWDTSLIPRTSLWAAQSEQGMKGSFDGPWPRVIIVQCWPLLSAQQALPDSIGCSVVQAPVLFQ